MCVRCFNIEADGTCQTTGCHSCLMILLFPAFFVEVRTMCEVKNDHLKITSWQVHIDRATDRPSTTLVLIVTVR